MVFKLKLVLIAAVIVAVLETSSETIKDRIAQLKSSYRDYEAKNLVLFIGDGMGLSSISAARSLRGQLHPNKLEQLLTLESLPYTGLIDTHCQGTFSSESGCTASAIFSGIKQIPKTLGISNVEAGNCDIEKLKKAKFNTILDLAKASNMKVGIVTNTRITHATPAALYAKTSNRFWTMSQYIPKDCDVESIGEQFEKRIHEFDVAFGGGLKHLPSHIAGKDMSSAFPNVHFLTTAKELKNFKKSQDSKPVIGVFAEDHLYNAINKSDKKEPSLSSMVSRAIDFLENKNGYVLVVENGIIDMYHHRSFLYKSLKEVLALDDVVNETLERVNLDDTLIIVTSDHATSFTFSGYNRGVFEYPMFNQSILNTSFMIYAHGRRGFKPGDEKQIIDNINKRYPSMIKDEAGGTHGMSNVYIGADGPRAFLLTGVHEQTYIFKVIEYAIGFNRHSGAPTLIAMTVSIIFLVIS